MYDYPQSYTDFVILCYLNSTHVHPSPQRINSCLNFLLQGIFTIHVELWYIFQKRKHQVTAYQSWRKVILPPWAPLLKKVILKNCLLNLYGFCCYKPFSHVASGRGRYHWYVSHTMHTRRHLEPFQSQISYSLCEGSEMPIITTVVAASPEFGIKPLYKVSSWPFFKLAYQEDSYLLSWKLVSHF